MAADLLGISRLLAKTIAWVFAPTGVGFGWLSKNLDCFYAGADRRGDGGKVESAKEGRAVPSRVTHAATRVISDG